MYGRRLGLAFFRFNGINASESNFWLNIALFQKFIVIHHKEIKNEEVWICR